MKTIAVVVLLAVGPAFGQGSPSITTPLLRGMPSLEVDVRCNGSVPLSCSALQAATELRLRSAGIPIRSGGPQLHVLFDAMAIKPDNPSWGSALMTRVVITDSVRSMRDSDAYFLASVWQGSTLQLTTRPYDAARSDMTQLLDSFLNAFLDANPRTAPAKLPDPGGL